MRFNRDIHPKGYRHVVRGFGLVMLLAVVMPTMSGLLQAQEENDCRRALSAIYDRMLSSADGGTCRVRYTVRTTAQAGGRTMTSQTAFTVLAGRGAMQLTGEDMSVYQDRTTVVMLIPARRTIVVQAGDPAASTRANPLAGMRDSILATAELAECVAIRNSAADHRATLVLGLREQRRSGIRSVTILYNEKKGVLCSITMNHIPNQRTQRTEITFNEIDYNYNGGELAKPAIAAVFDANGRLLPRYRGYSLRDLRRTR